MVYSDGVVRHRSDADHEHKRVPHAAQRGAERGRWVRLRVAGERRLGCGVEQRVGRVVRKCQRLRLARPGLGLGKRVRAWPIYRHQAAQLSGHPQGAGLPTAGLTTRGLRPPFHQLL